MIFLMIASHDTTTITSSAMAYYLAKQPEWQDRARESHWPSATTSSTSTRSTSSRPSTSS